MKDVKNIVIKVGVGIIVVVVLFYLILALTK